MRELCFYFGAPLVLGLALFGIGCVSEPGNPGSVTPATELRAILVVPERDARGQYVTPPCPVHHTRPVSRCVQYRCGAGCVLQTKEERL